MQFVLDSPLVAASPAFADYARAVVRARPRRSLEAVADLSSRIHADFAYEPGVDDGRHAARARSSRAARASARTSPTSAIACLRSVGLPARYVSGYLETDPPPGRPKLAGADVSHAWVSVLVPGAGWVDVDPTNDQLVNDRYVVDRVRAATTATCRRSRA